MIDKENDIEKLVAQVCAELTQDNILVGVSDEQNQTAKQLTKKETETQRKRDAKKARKDKEKLDKAIENQEEKVSQAENITLKINFSRFVAEERRDAVIALAKVKFFPSNGDDNLIVVFQALAKFESKS